MMKLFLSNELMDKIHAHGEDSYPDEGAGLLLGSSYGDSRRVDAVLELTNSREDTARHNRYLITAQDMMRGEREAVRLGLDIIGIFHSHPDHPNYPSDYDLEWALPWFSYIITNIVGGKAIESRSWRLTDDRENFAEEIITNATV
jgi:proteasome lid subunit RPN8/RPN11